MENIMEAVGNMWWQLLLWASSRADVRARGGLRVRHGGKAAGSFGDRGGIGGSGRSEQ